MSYLSRLWLNPRSSTVRHNLSDVQALHRTIMSGFPKIAADGRARQSYGVLYRLDRTRNGRLSLLVQSESEPDWKGLPEDFLETGDPFDEIIVNPAVKQVAWGPSAFVAGRHFRFRLRANPVKCVDTKTGADGRRRHGRRVALTHEEDRLAWLNRKADLHGFRVLKAQVSGVGVAEVLDVTEGHVVGRRRRGDEVEVMTFASSVFEGLLEVTDPDRFLAAIRGGIGRAKAYGFGLLSLAPPEAGDAS